MLDCCAEHEVLADVEVIDAEDLHSAYERFGCGDVRYRLVLALPTLPSSALHRPVPAPDRKSALSYVRTY
jgi:uncharacterized zinc-type alcohol dehydrogenase-like protein